ncbi:MAG TPA: YecA family protein, partial [Burkholderiaceae bacterium]|nr:YecA family protein [Burkholderiaceae bacterium]
ALIEPLATLYMHLDPEDLEDADELLAEIETLEPPQDLAEAVEGLVSSTLLLADVSRPLRKPGGHPKGSRGGGRTGPHRR